MATLPDRRRNLRLCIESLAPQLRAEDRLAIHFDRGGPPSPVDQAWIDDRVPCAFEWTTGILGDGGKFLAAFQAPADTVVFTCDDDLIYPADYLRRLEQHLHFYRGMLGPSAVGVHAYSFPPKLVHAKDRTVRRPCLHGTYPSDLRVNVLGTGTLCFLRGDFPGLDLVPFQEPMNIADIHFALLAQTLRRPMVSIAREVGWLGYSLPSDAVTIHSQHANKVGRKRYLKLVQRCAHWEVF